MSESNTSARSAASGNNSEDASVEAACEESMRNWIGAVVVFLCACVWLVTSADAQSASERMDNLMALYMVRASEPLCGFKMTDEQRSEVLKAARYLEEKLQLSSEKAEELYNKVAQSMEAQKAGCLCEPNGEWGHAFKQTVESFAGRERLGALPPIRCQRLRLRRPQPQVQHRKPPRLDSNPAQPPLHQRGRRS